jgi:exonuclease III
VPIWATSTTMKLLSWKCRGLTRASVVRNLRVKLRNLSPDVIFLSETKAPPSVTSVILNDE